VKLPHGFLTVIVFACEREQEEGDKASGKKK